jgi:phage/plasmid-associated DNA primase
MTRAEHDKTYYRKHKEAIRARVQAWRAANPERQKENHARWLAANLERRREIARLSYYRRKAKQNEPTPHQTIQAG